RRGLTFALAGLVLAFLSLLASRLGSEFIPSLSEGDFAQQALRVPGTSLTESVDMQQRLEKTLLAQVPEIERVFARTGTAEIASDPMPPNISDSYVMLKPKAQWPDPNKSREALIADIQRASALVPGSAYELSQPIQVRFNELISGVRSDVAVKV
ncbi:CusA/CzcA family heavy metal efflux RND transporter, partial [Pseudomonas sp. MWU13-2625]